MNTNFTLLRMDLTNYAVLVFDLAPDTTALAGVNLASFQLYLSKMALATTRHAERRITNTTVKNIIKTIKEVTEGWES
jgi:hypothetical protein